jgi:CRP/FNR family transcriptional regulator
MYTRSTSTQKPDSVRSAFQTFPFFISLKTETQDAILNLAIPRHFSSGQVIYLEGEPAEHVFILTKGWVKATKIAKEGREQGLMFLKPVEIFGDIAVFAGTSYPGTTTALEDAETLAIPAPALLKLVTSHHDLSAAVIQRLSQRVLGFIDLVEDLSLRNVEARLACSLLRNVQVVDGQNVVPRRDWTTLDQMAVRLGTVRDVISRAMKNLETAGLIRVEKNTIYLLDPIKLAQRAEE